MLCWSSLEKRASANRSYRLASLVAAALVFLPAIAAAQSVPPRPSTFAPIAAPAASERVQISAEAMPAQTGPPVEQFLADGAKLEAAGRWADALGHYEDALRKHPNSSQLETRFNAVRLHFSLEQRYADASFLESLRTLDNNQASQLYGELLRKVDSHYVVSPPWREIAYRGARSLQIAIDSPKFRQTHGLRISDRQRNQFLNEVRTIAANRGSFRTRASVTAFEADVARAAAHRLGVSPVATALEFASAAVGGLDHYSGFLTPGQLRDVYSQIEGNFVGLGVELKADDGALLIVRVIPNSPAERAGIRDGDRITAVDGRETSALSTDEAASLLTGEAGSLVRVRVTTPGRRVAARPVDGQIAATADALPWTRDVTVRREHVDVPALENVKIVDQQYGVAYVRIPVFQKTTSRDLEASLWDLHRKGMRSLVIDLRGNPGGLLTSSVELADKFVAQGNIVSTRGRSDGEDFDYRAHRAGTWRVPLVVLIDGDSASASEIFAAAISDNRRGTIVGDRSFGKGSVQGIFPLGFGGAGVRLTTAKFFSPNGNPISKIGVNPDIVVPSDAQASDVRHEVGFRGPGSSGPNRRDAALTRAVETARHQVALR